MHFTTSMDQERIPNLTIHGLVDVSAYENLTIEGAREALEGAEGVVREFLSFVETASDRGTDEQFHLWTGTPPSSDRSDES